MSGPECCSNPPLLNPNAGAGHVEKLAGIDSYIAGSPNSNLTVLLISDVYGNLSSKFHLYSLMLFSSFMYHKSFLFFVNLTCSMYFPGYEAPHLRYGLVLESPVYFLFIF